MTVLPVAVPEPDGYRTQLAALGTKLEYLHPALRAGEVARRSATRNHPANTAGTRAYQEHVRIIREMHIRHEGWKRLLHDHLELVCNPDRTVAFGVMSGDGATGERTFPPRTRAVVARPRSGSPRTTPRNWSCSRCTAGTRSSSAQRRPVTSRSGSSSPAASSR